jgi:hypothetical protein
MQSYKFTYKKLLKHTLTAVGHRYDPTFDKMEVYHQDQSITIIAEWRKCELSLSKDWVQFTKSQMEKESGQTIKLNVKE